jgi:hypothetical protein
MILRFLILLYISGITLVISSIARLAWISFSPDKTVVAHYSDVILKILDLFFGCGLLFVARCVQKRLILGWRLFFGVLVAAWLCFSYGGAEAIANDSQEHSLVGELIFGGFLALVSSPVLVYWCIRWHKERKSFGTGDG